MTSTVVRFRIRDRSRSAVMTWTWYFSNALMSLTEGSKIAGGECKTGRAGERDVGCGLGWRPCWGMMLAANGSMGRGEVEGVNWKDDEYFEKESSWCQHCQMLSVRPTCPSRLLYRNEASWQACADKSWCDGIYVDTSGQAPEARK